MDIESSRVEFEKQARRYLQGIAAPSEAFKPDVSDVLSVEQKICTLFGALTAELFVPLHQLYWAAQVGALRNNTSEQIEAVIKAIKLIRNAEKRMGKLFRDAGFSHDEFEDNAQFDKDNYSSLQDNIHNQYICLANMLQATRTLTERGQQKELKTFHRETNDQLYKLHRDYEKQLLPQTFGQALARELTRVAAQFTTKYKRTLIIEPPPIV
ncbi:MAG: hypothetical protein FWF33_07175 [Clostridiales bacterium]|nr:hypothetical protein [Clostridiales bacterium]